MTYKATFSLEVGRKHLSIPFSESLCLRFQFYNCAYIHIVVLKCRVSSESV